MLLRQDPPFDLAYITSTHFLEQIQSRTLVVNDPAAVRNAPEKLFVMEFADLMPPTLITRDRAAIEAFRAEHGEIVMKPLYGHGGASVFKVATRDPNFGSLFDLFHTIVPRALGGAAIPARASSRATSASCSSTARPLGAVNRIPAQNDIRSNMVRGGAAAATALTDARARDLRAARPGAEGARPAVRRHRRDRRPSDRDQCHLADRPARARRGSAAPISPSPIFDAIEAQARRLCARMAEMRALEAAARH